MVSSITESLVQKLNAVAQDPETAETIKQNFLSNTKVMAQGRFKLQDYLNAVAYVSFKMMGHTNEESYAKVFPTRYAAMKAKGQKTSNFVAAYNKNKLVNLITEQTLIPAWILNHAVYQRAIDTQAFLMVNAKSEKVRSDAANSILTHLKKPEKTELELNIGVHENDEMKTLKDMLTALAVQQQKAIESGIPTAQIAHQPFKAESDVIEAEIVAAGRKTDS